MQMYGKDLVIFLRLGGASLGGQFMKGRAEHRGEAGGMKLNMLNISLFLCS